MASTTITDADVEPQFDAYIVFSKRSCEDMFYADYTDAIGLFQTRQGAIDRVNELVAFRKAKYAESQYKHELYYAYFVEGWRFKDGANTHLQPGKAVIHEAIGEAWESFEQRTGRGDY